mgnify:CR=1 FL=1
MSNSSVPLLSAHSITKSFGPRTARHQVLFDVSADVHAGECLAVIGGSGSGKSTLTRIMLGLESADSGSVEYESQSIVGGRAPRIGTGVPGPVLLARPTLASRQISG